MGVHRPGGVEHNVQVQPLGRDAERAGHRTSPRCIRAEGAERLCTHRGADALDQVDPRIGDLLGRLIGHEDLEVHVAEGVAEADCETAHEVGGYDSIVGLENLPSGGDEGLLGRERRGPDAGEGVVT